MAGKTSAESPVLRKWRRLRFVRRVSQGIFLFFFLWLIGISVSKTGASVDASVTSLVSFPVELFLDLDPFAGFMVLLSTGTIPGLAVLWIVTLIFGFLFGRGFCGWVCPMGTMNHLVGEIKPTVKGAKRVEANRTKPYQKIKYLILVVALFAALFGSAIGGLLDPLCLATRGIALTVVPVVEWCIRTAISSASQSDFVPLQAAADVAFRLSDKVFVNGKGTMVQGGVVLAVLFIAVLAINRFIPRFWCRGLCPLGALLGLSGRFGLLTLRKEKSSCTDCGKCELSCQGAASPRPGDKWQRAECDLCLNCAAACEKSQSLAFGLSGYVTDEAASPDLKRRQLITGTALGAAIVPTFRIGALNSTIGRPSPERIRPPGAADEKNFLERCIRCGQCMKICPNNALHPAVSEAGIEGLWTPILVPRIGYCEPTCTLCTQVCPTAAIRRVSDKEKFQDPPQELMKIGTAFIDRGRCLPWAMDTSCIVCEEFCPMSPKAIVFDDESSDEQLKRPVIRPDRCSGCGACEYICPVNDRAAVRVSSAGESRSPSNSLLAKKK
jgi:polyferredoxin